MTWTHFRDMNSGGGRKEAFNHCYIEAPKNEAVKIFYHRFGHNPYRVSCTCCGEDYSISSGEDLHQLTAFHRNGRYVKEQGDRGLFSYVTLEDYLKSDDVCVIRKDEIKDHERVGDLPEQGYVWVG